MSVLVVCPTRDRPPRMRRMAESFLATTTTAKLVIVVDEDQRALYTEECNGGDRVPESDRIELVIGPRQPLVKMVNDQILCRLDSHDTFGLMVDDAVFTVSGWDDYLGEIVDQWDGAPGVISPHHNYGRHIDIPYVTKQWVERLGWFANPVFDYWCWPTFTGMLGEATRVVHAPADRFSLLHEDEGPRYWSTLPAEAEVFYKNMLWEFYPLVDKLGGRK